MKEMREIDMHERLEQRLTELQSELAAGQKMQTELDAKRVQLQATMLRIEGAIQVIEEVLHTEPAPALESSTTLPPAPPSGNGAEQAKLV